MAGILASRETACHPPPLVGPVCVRSRLKSRGRFLRVIWAAVLIFAVCPTVLRAQEEEEEEAQPVVNKVSIEGNQRFSDDEIKAVIATRESGCKSIILFPLCKLGFGVARRLVRFDPRELRTDVARIRVFYYRRGYRDAAVDTSVVRQDHQVDITFRVQEGQPVVVRDLTVSGLEGILDSASVVGSLPLKSGRPLSEIAVTDSRNRIEDALRNRGYARAEVLVFTWLPTSPPLTADVTLRAVPGARVRIGQIEVIGAKDVAPKSVRRLLSFKTGDIYREREIVRSQRNLYSLALFEYADVQPDLSGTDTIVPVRVQVNEAGIRDVRLGLGFTTVECVQVEAGWTHRNFFGGARRLQITSALSNIFTRQLNQSFPCQQAGVKDEPGSPFNKLDWRVRADFQQPWFISSRNSLRLGLFAERQSVQPIFARLSYGGDVTFAREISTGTPLTLAYRAERDSLEAGSAGFLFCASFGICRREDIEELQRTRWLSSVDVALSRNRTDVLFDPTRGYRFSAEVEHGSKITGSDYFFNRIQGELSAYRAMGSNTVLAVRFRGGWVRPIGRGIDVSGGAASTARDVTHPLKRMYAGGPTTVRGYGQNLLGPKVLKVDSTALNRVGCDPSGIDLAANIWTCQPKDTVLGSSGVDPRPIGGLNMVVANIELRFPLIGERLRGAAFVDAGQVWSPGEGVASLGDLAWSPGLGVRYQSPVGPLRLDIGYNTGGVEHRQAVVELDNHILQVTDRSGEPIVFDYNPFQGSGLRAFVRRLQLNFSIGQAF